MRQHEVLSMTTAPAAAARGANTFDTFAPGEESTMSVEGVERLHLEDLVLAEGDFPAD
jgi:hypothetical protein